MRKFLLFVASMATACCAFANENPLKEPAILIEEDGMGYLVTGISPNGKWAVSEFYGDLCIFDVENDFFPYPLWPQTATEYYSTGMGNYISNDGTVLLCSSQNIMLPQYWKDEEISTLPFDEDREYGGLANGITPDGSRICGTVMRAKFSIESEDVCMQTPVVWDRNSDGSYGMYTELPAPKLDFQDRVPQYITAIAISTDGKTVAGQIRSGNGFFHLPIVYRQSESGEWSYEVLQERLVKTHPEIILPEHPGDGPEKKDFMSPAKRIEYLADVKEWEETGGDDYSTYPNIDDYMTAEEIANYDKANIEWTEKWNAYNEAMFAQTEGCLLYNFNNVLLSSNGRYYVTTHTSVDEDPVTGDYYEVSYPVVFDLNLNRYELRQNKEDNSKCYFATFVSNNAEVLANDFYAMDNWGFFRNCYYSTKGGNYTPIQDWVKTQNTDTYNWMDENMRHDYIGIDLKTLEEYPVTNGWLTGSAVANPDMSIISLWVYTTWQSEELPYFNSYMLPIKSEITGVKRIADTTSQLSVTTGKGGVINISGDASSATVLDINGRVLYNASNPASTIATGIENGFYLVKVTDREGNTVVKKVNF